MNNNIGENLRRLREERGMPVERVARMLGVGADLVGKWESGRERPDADNLRLIARLFGVPEDELKKAPGGGSGGDFGGSGGVGGSGSGDGTGGPDARESSDAEARGFERSPLIRYIATDERVLWFGQPTDERVGGRRGQTMGTIFIGLLFILFSVIWTRSGLPFSVFFGLIFFAFGIYSIFGRAIILGINKPNTYYAVTDRRVMMLIIGSWNRFRDIRYGRMSGAKLILSRRKTGCGTIVFSSPNLIPEYPYGRYHDRVANTNSLLDSFADIAGAQRVYNLINEAKSAYPYD